LLVTERVPHIYNAGADTMSALPFPDDPWWAFLWPGGWGLTEFVLGNPSLTRGKTVLDLGSGCGSSSLAAVLCGATRVVSNDVCPWAGTAVALNAAASGLGAKADSVLAFEQRDLLADTAPQPTFADVVLVGDMLFDEQMGARVWSFARQQHTRGSTVLVGDPGRHVIGAYEPHLSLVGEFELEQDGGGHGDWESLIFQHGLGAKSAVWRLV
jgi:predicted nicotinamide N-methyase